MEFKDLLVEAYSRPDPNPVYPFDVGQKARLLKGRSRDGQTPRCWDGAMVEIVSFYCTGIYKDHWYKVKHLELGAIEEFKEDEFDWRYAKKRVKNETPNTTSSPTPDADRQADS